MPRYEIEFAARAAKQLTALDRTTQLRLAKAIDALKLDPRPDGAKQLRATVGLWRIRVGAYRVVYAIEDDRLVVLVIKIGHRRDVYRGEL